jgi:hypothetical protein
MRPLLVLVACAAMAACASTPTVYGPAAPSPYASGFWERRIEADRFQVSYRGGSAATAAQVHDYALLRAADLTREQGYDWFRVVGRFGEAQGPRSSSSMSIVGGSANWGRHSASGVGVGLAFPIGDSGPQLTETLEVVMGRGARPFEPDAYEARSVQESIRPRLPPPAP